MSRLPVKIQRLLHGLISHALAVFFRLVYHIICPLFLLILQTLRKYLFLVATPKNTSRRLAQMTKPFSA